MAGSYGHLIDDEGKPYVDEHGVLDTSLIENIGDCAEVLEELMGMIWWLAQADQIVIADARRHYKSGLRLANVTPFGE